MSYTTWHNYGYGICVDDIKTRDVTRLESMLKLEECSISEPVWDDYMEFDQDFMLGLATILQKVIEEAEGLCLTACDDCDSRTYLIYQPRYPWALTQADRDLTEEHLAAMFGRYVGMLTDEVVDVDYQEVENGG